MEGFCQLASPQMVGSRGFFAPCMKAADDTSTRQHVKRQISRRWSTEAGLRLRRMNSLKTLKLPAEADSDPLKHARVLHLLYFLIMMERHYEAQLLSESGSTLFFVQ